jgi:hypothetical protein
MDTELVREHCHGKKAHKAKSTHKAHGCTKATKKPAAKARTPARRKV